MFELSGKKEKFEETCGTELVRQLSSSSTLIGGYGAAELSDGLRKIERIILSWY